MPDYSRMYDSYSEHLEFEAGAASEFQNCYAEACATPSHDETSRALALAEAGKFPVCYDYEVCCKATDALVRVELRIAGVFDTEAEAQAFLARRDYCEYFLFRRDEPAEPVSAFQRELEAEDEIPF